MTTLQLPLTSVEYLTVHVKLTAAGAVVDDPDGLGWTAEMAVCRNANPTAWQAASWQPTPGGRDVLCAVGTGTALGALLSGRWQVYVRLSRGVEHIVRFAGWLEAA